MRTQTNEVQAIYNNAIRWQQNVGKTFFIVMTEADRVAIYKKAQLDIEKIAQAAGVEMLKTAHIMVRRGMRAQQETGLKELNRLLQEIGSAQVWEDAITRTGIAVGYANAMCHFGFMSENELKDVIGVIGQAGERTTRQIKTASRPFWLRIIKNPVRETMWARRVRQLYANRIISAVGLAVALVTAIEVILAIFKYFI